jgi:hypothetical protein
MYLNTMRRRIYKNKRRRGSSNIATMVAELLATLTQRRRRRNRKAARDDGGRDDGGGTMIVAVHDADAVATDPHNRMVCHVGTLGDTFLHHDADMSNDMSPTCQRQTLHVSHFGGLADMPTSDICQLSLMAAFNVSCESTISIICGSNSVA